MKTLVLHAAKNALVWNKGCNRPGGQLLFTWTAIFLTMYFQFHNRNKQNYSIKEEVEEEVRCELEVVLKEGVQYKLVQMHSGC